MNRVNELALEPYFVTPKAKHYKQALDITLATLQAIYPSDNFEVNTYYHKERPVTGVFCEPDAPARKASDGSFVHTTLTVIDSDAFKKAGYVETIIERKASADTPTDTPQKFYMYAKGSAPDQIYFESSCFEPKAYLSIFSELKDHFKWWRPLKKILAKQKFAPKCLLTTTIKPPSFWRVVFLFWTTIYPYPLVYAAYQAYI